MSKPIMSERSMESLPMVSIVVPAYEAARFVGDMLTSVQAQTVSSWELVLVDDGSKDETLAVAKQYAESDPRIRVLTQPNAGPSAARNRGYAETSPGTKYIIFLDADDLWKADTLETLIDVLESNPAALAAYGKAEYITADGQPIYDEFFDDHQRQRWGIEGNRIVRWPAEKPTVFAVEALMERVITAGTVLIRRRALEVAGLWNADLRMWEDWDLWLRICLHGDMAFTDKVVLSYRRHNSNLSNDQYGLDVGELHVRQRLISSLIKDDIHQAIAVTGFRQSKKCISLQFWGLAKTAWQHRKPIAALKWARRATISYWKYLRQSNHVPEIAL